MYIDSENQFVNNEIINKPERAHIADIGAQRRFIKRTFT